MVWRPQLLVPLLICSLVATVFAFLVQTSMQRYISHTNTALIFCTEPVFAALYARLVLNERLGVYGYAGATCILGGMMISILPEKNHKRNMQGEDRCAYWFDALFSKLSQIEKSRDSASFLLTLAWRKEYKCNSSR